MNLALIEQRKHYSAVRARLNAAPVKIAPPPAPVPVASPAPWQRDWLKIASPPERLKAFEVSARAKSIIAETCLKHGVSREDIMADRRQAKIVRARFEAMWRLKKETPWSYPRIGKFMGDRDHTTVLNACRKHEWRLSSGEAK